MNTATMLDHSNVKLVALRFTLYRELNESLAHSFINYKTETKNDYIFRVLFVAYFAAKSVCPVFILNNVLAPRLLLPGLFF